MMKICVLLAVFALSFVTHAEVASITFSAIVKSFDKNSVVCEANNMTLVVKRANVLQKKFKQGDAILVVVPGRDIASLIKPKKK